MTDYLTKESMLEFNRLRQRAFLEEVFNFFTRKPKDLLPFEAVRDQLKLSHASYRGLQEIELDKIVGSVGRYRDFTRTFMPRSDLQEKRWRRVDSVAHSQLGFPPIEVFKVGEVYFVRDGNHRVSVARAHNSPSIEAYVTEYFTPVPLDVDDDLDSILIKADFANFLRLTQLDVNRPDHRLQLTEPGRYGLLLDYIAQHKYFKELEAGRELSFAEAAVSWYDSEFLPTVHYLRERNILKDFPRRTEADLYTWLVYHRSELEKHYGLGQVSTPELVEDLAEDAMANPLGRLGRALARLVNPGEPFAGYGPRHLLDKADQASFLRVTRLNDLRPNHRIQLTKTAHYRLLVKYISQHKYFKERERSCELSFAEAAASWYDDEYLPVVRILREADVLRHFPKQTEADLYVWLVKRRSELEKRQGLGTVSVPELLDPLLKRARRHPLERLGRSVARLIT